MKIIILEADKEELAANRRIADTIVDVLTNFLDSFTVLNNYTEQYDNNNDNNILEEEVDEDGSNEC